MGSKLKEYREAHGMTMTKAAAIAGIPYRTWQNWENGTRNCPEYIEKLIIFYFDHRLDE